MSWCFETDTVDERYQALSGIQIMLQSHIGRKTINHNFTSMNCYAMRRDGDHATMIVR